MKSYKSVNYYIDRDSEIIYRYRKNTRGYTKDIYDLIDKEWMQCNTEYELPDKHFLESISEQEAFIEIL